MDFDEPKSGGPLPWLLVFALGLLAYGLYSAFQTTPPTPEKPEPPPAPLAIPAPHEDRPHLELGTLESASSMPRMPETAPQPQPAPTVEAAAASSTPAPEQNEEAWRRQAAGLSAEPHYQAWLRHEHVLDKLALLVENLAEGRLPSRLRSGLPRLRAPFATTTLEQDNSRYRLDPAGYRRYKPLLDAFAALDDNAVLAIYRLGKPLLQQAYAELGNPGQDFDAALIAAIDRILAVRLPSGPIELVRPSVMFKYADPVLEKRSPLEKQLLRMGPENTGVLQNKLRRLRIALSQPPKSSDPLAAPMPASPSLKTGSAPPP